MKIFISSALPGISRGRILSVKGSQQLSVTTNGIAFSMYKSGKYKYIRMDRPRKWSKDLTDVIGTISVFDGIVTVRTRDSRR